MAWLHFQIRQNNPNQQSPTEWDIFAGKLLQTFPRRNVEKIELASFTAKSSREVRWLLPIIDPEYCTEDEAIKISKKLAFLMLNAQNSVGIPIDLNEEYPESEFKREMLVCPLCKEIIDITDFDKDGRTDPKSIHMGHEIPLSQQPNSHNANNVFWIHRRCNYIKGEQTLRKALDSLIEIIRNHIRV